jgi:hypothetical protein
MALKLGMEILQCDSGNIVNIMLLSPVEAYASHHLPRWWGKKVFEVYHISSS